MFTFNEFSQSLCCLDITITLENMPHEIFAFCEDGLKGFQSNTTDNNSVVLAYRKSNIESEQDVRLPYFTKKAADWSDTLNKDNNY